MYGHKLFDCNIGGPIESPFNIYNRPNSISFSCFSILLTGWRNAVSVHLPFLWAYWETSRGCLNNGSLLTNLSIYIEFLTENTWGWHVSSVAETWSFHPAEKFFQALVWKILVFLKGCTKREKFYLYLVICRVLGAWEPNPPLYNKQLLLITSSGIHLLPSVIKRALETWKVYLHNVSQALPTYCV